MIRHENSDANVVLQGRILFPSGFQSYNSSMTVGIFCGIQVAFSKGAVDTMRIISAGQIKAQEPQNGSTVANKPGDAGDADDPSFGLLMGSLLTSIFQSGQQILLDAAKLSDGASLAGKASEQLQLPEAEPQTAERSKPLFRIQNQDMSTETENTLAPQFSELLNNIKECIDGQEPAQKATTETKGSSVAENAPSFQNDGNGKNVVNLPDKFGKRDASLLRDVTALNSQDKNDDGRQKAAPTIIGPSKTDFSTMVQQAQTPDFSAVSHNAAARTTETGALSAAARPNGVETSDAFDQVVSVLKDGNRLAVQMNHSGLGKLDINLSLDKGSVNAHINVADNATKKMIENDMQQIVNSILGDGVSVSGFSVSLRQQGKWDGSNQYQQDETKQGSDTDIHSVAAPSTNVAQGLVNIFI